MKNTIIPKLYFKLLNNNYLNYLSSKYIYIYECEWLQKEEMLKSNYKDENSKIILPFAINGGGDKLVFVDNGTEEPYIGFLYHDICEVEYYAKDLESAIMCRIIDFLTVDAFCRDMEQKIDDTYYTIDEYNELLDSYIQTFKTCFSCSNINLLKELKKLGLKKCSDDYMEWEAYLTFDEADKIINDIFKFDLRGESFKYHLTV